MDRRRRETFKSGLIGAAKATNAWVLTAGTNTGVMRLVGEAVEEGQFLISDGGVMRRGIKAIGLCSWGYVHSNQRLVNPDPSRANTVRYNAGQEVRPHQPVALNPNHTHFLLVDDGYRYSWYGTGGVRRFIGSFESLVAEPAPGGLGIPVVSLIVEGGTDAIFEAKDKLSHGQPCVVVEGTGRAADILSYAHRHASKDAGDGVYKLKQGNIQHIQAMLRESFADRIRGEEGEKRMKTFVNWVLECVRYSDLISVFDIRVEENLDYTILTSLLKGSDLNLTSQLYLALVWDRVDIAEEKIFSNKEMGINIVSPK